MFLGKFLWASVLVTLVVAKVPSYIKVCGRKSPDLDKCVLESVEALKDKLREGIPDLDVPGIDPFKIDKLELLNMPNFKGNAVNVTVTGLSDYELKHLHVDLKKMKLEVELVFKQLKLDGFYDINTRILVPVTGKGPLVITSNNLFSKAVLDWKLVDRNGKKYLFFVSMTARLFVKDYNAELDLDSGNSALQQAINQVLGSSHQEIIEATTPALEQYVASNCLRMSNNICKHFTYDELYPDEE